MTITETTFTEYLELLLWQLFSRPELQQNVSGGNA